VAIYYVPTRFIPDVWPSIEGYVARTCEYHPFMDTPDVLALLNHELATLFIATDDAGVVGFGVLEVVQYPSRRIANVLGAGGRRGFLAVAVNELLPFMIAHGKDQGSTVVALSGRPGWLRALRHLKGRSQPYITWWADIDEGRRQLAAAAPDDHARTVEASAAISH
jgi:hypothetical protein